MTSRACMLFAFTGFLLLLAVPAHAQQDEEGRWSAAIAGGMVDSDHGAQPYLTGNLRYRIGYRSAGEERQSSVSGYVEPEVGYWNYSKAGTREGATLVGVNIGGAVRLRSFEYFVGGGVGYNFLNNEVPRVGGGSIKTTNGKVGVNAQFGFDVRMSDLVSLFGVGRYDLIQDSPRPQQTKVYLGLRFHL